MGKHSNDKYGCGPQIFWAWCDRRASVYGGCTTAIWGEMNRLSGVAHLLRVSKGRRGEEDGHKEDKITPSEMNVEPYATSGWFDICDGHLDSKISRKRCPYLFGPSNRGKLKNVPRCPRCPKVLQECLQYLKENWAWRGWGFELHLREDVSEMKDLADTVGRVWAGRRGLHEECLRKAALPTLLISPPTPPWLVLHVLDSRSWLGSWWFLLTPCK